MEKKASDTGRVLSGRVVSGLGQGARLTQLDWLREQMEQKLGFVPYPGTFNLSLQDEASLSLWREVRFSPAIELIKEGFCRGRCYRALVEGKLEAAIVFPDVQGYPEDRVEIMAAVNLREALGVVDGDWVFLQVLEG